MSWLFDVVPVRRTTGLLPIGLFCLGNALLAAGAARAQPPEVAPVPRSSYGTPLAELPPPPPGPVNPADKFKIDADRLAFAAVEDDAPVRSESESSLEFEAYNQVLLHARQFTVAEQEKYATKDVVFLDLVKPVRKDFQFKLVYFEGRLKRLRRLEPTKPLAAAGVADMYEGWIFPHGGADPMCVLITELPAGLEPAVEYNPPKPVTVAGYPFKLIRYEATAMDKKDPTRHEFRRAPLLMARSLTVLPAPDADGGKSWREGFLPGIMALLGGISAVTLALTFMFRRGDKKVRSELAVRRSVNPFPTPPTAADANTPDPNTPPPSRPI